MVKAPGVPATAVTLVISGALTVKSVSLDHSRLCITRALPDFTVEATAATTWVSLQLRTVAEKPPSDTVPLQRWGPNPVPESVTCRPSRLVRAVASVGATAGVTVTFAVKGLNSGFAITVMAAAEPKSYTVAATVAEVCPAGTTID